VKKKKGWIMGESKGVIIHYMNGSRYFDSSWYVDFGWTWEKASK